MATDVLTAEQRLVRHHQLLLHQFDQHAEAQQQQALAVLDDDVDDECAEALQQQLGLQRSRLEQRLAAIAHSKLLAPPPPPQPPPPRPASPPAIHSASHPTSHLYLSQQILQLLDAATQMLGDKQTAIHTLVNLIAQQAPTSAATAPPTPPATAHTLRPSAAEQHAQDHSQLLTIDLWKARDAGASPVESPSSTRAQYSSTRVSTAPSSPSPVASPLDSPVHSSLSPSLSPRASPAASSDFVHPSLLSSPLYRPVERPHPPSPHPPTPERPVNIRVRKSFSYAPSPMQSPEPAAEAKRVTMQSPLTVERLDEQESEERREAAERRARLRRDYEQHAADAERKVDWRNDLSSEFEQIVSQPQPSRAPAQQQPIDVVLSRSALSSSASSSKPSKQLRPSTGPGAASPVRLARHKQPASSSLKSATSSSSARSASTFSVPAAYASYNAASSLSASLTARKQQLRRQREQAAISASQHNMSRAYDIQASVKSASMKRREEEDDRRRRLEAERSRAQEEERRKAHSAHVRRMRQEEEEKRRRRAERDRQREAMNASAQLRERQRQREERQRLEQEEEEAEQQHQHSRNSRSVDSHRLERLLRDASMTRSESRGRREAALRELAERSVHEAEVEREERRRGAFNEDWTERMLREMMEEYQLEPNRAAHVR